MDLAVEFYDQPALESDEVDDVGTDRLLAAEPHPESASSNTHDTLFNAFFTPHPNLDELTMLDLVSTGGGSDPVRRAARSVVAAYLNASHGDVAYPYTTAELVAMWAAAVAADSFQALHTLLDGANNLGCFEDVEAATAAMALPLLPLGAAWLAYRRRRR